ncbi:unnamed protein product, partial [Symbiodinium pilosum]
VFVRIKAVAFSGNGSPVRVFVIGNSFGFSALFLGLLFRTKGSFLDALDLEPDACHRMGGWLTRAIARAQDLNISVTRGPSPQAVPSAMRGGSYDLAFIDGGHFEKQLQQDFEAVHPFMAATSVIVLHDIVLVGLYDFVMRYFAASAWESHLPRGCTYKNIAGT